MLNVWTDMYSTVVIFSQIISVSLPNPLPLSPVHFCVDLVLIVTDEDA